MQKPIMLCLFLCLVAAGCTKSPQKAAQDFLDKYTAELLPLYYASSLAEWRSNTMIIEGDSTNAIATRMANEALAKFTGDTANIRFARKFLADSSQLTDLQIRELKAILYNAAKNPQTVPEIVREKIRVETAQVEKLFGFDFKIDGKSVSANQIDDILKKETSLKARLKAWEASKEVGKGLKPGLLQLRDLRNQTVQALGYSDYFSYQVSQYGMSTTEMRELMLKLNREVRPLYEQLHTYVRYELAKKYGVGFVPDRIPAHWLPNRWGQDWNELITVAGLDLDGALSRKTPEWLVKQGEKFYISLGFPALPQSFWEKSSLYPLPAEAKYKKNNHASAWHLDLQNDVRCLMSVEPNASWYETVHHELGHIYYYISYTNPDVPPLLRAGANRAFHEGMGSMLGLAAMQKPFLQAIDLLPAASGNGSDDMQTLLKEALNYIVFIPWSAGVMSEFEYALYGENLPADQLNAKWWDLKERYQGIVPPAERGEEYCDAASKTHITDDPAQYYDYALSFVLLFQLHDHIARQILKQDPHETNYFGSKEVGEFLRQIMRPGASKDWRVVLKESTGEELSAQAMLTYFAPLMEFLKEKNQGRKSTLPAL